MALIKCMLLWHVLMHRRLQFRFSYFVSTVIRQLKIHFIVYPYIKTFRDITMLKLNIIFTVHICKYVGIHTRNKNDLTSKPVLENDCNFFGGDMTS